MKAFISLPSVVKALVMTYFILNLANCASRDIEKAFFRTLVSCNHHSPGLLAGGQHGHHEWTGSAHCDDKAEVLRTGLFIEGRMWSLTILMHVPLLPVLAAGADRWGRRPVLVTGVLGFVAFLFLLAASQAWDNVLVTDFSAGISLLNYPLFALSAYMLRGITFNFDVVWAAMLFDLTSDNASRACAFALLEGSNHFGAMLANLIAGYIGHLQLLDYSRIYICCACLVALAIPHVLTNVPETMRAQSEIRDDADSCNSAIVPSIVAGPKSKVQACGKLNQPFVGSLLGDISALLSDPKLVPLFVAEFLISVSRGVEALVATMTIASFGWVQGDLEYYQSLAPMVVLFSSLLGAPMITSYFGDRPLPEWFWCIVGAVDISVMGLWGLAALHPAFLLVPRYIWSIIAFQRPLISARVSNLVAADEQAKLYALRAASSCVAHAIALQLFSSGVFFDSAAAGFVATIPFAVSGLIGCIGCVAMLHVLAPQTCSHFSPLANGEEGEWLSGKSQKLAKGYAAYYGSEACGDVM